MLTLIVKIGDNCLTQTVDDKYKIDAPHLCSSCSNCQPNLCAKVKASLFAREEDRKRNGNKDIHDFPFITKGFQLSNENQILELYVEKCSLHRQGVRKPINTAKVRQLKNSLKMAYFDATSIGEANAIQKHMIETGQIKKGHWS